MLRQFVKSFLCIVVLVFASQLQAGNLNYKEFGLNFTEAVNKQDFATLRTMFDDYAFAQRVAETMYDDDRQVQSYAASFARHVESSSESFIQKMFTPFLNNGGSLKFHTMKGNLPILRANLGDNNGFDYYFLVTEITSEGKIVVVDLLTLNLSFSFSQQVGSLTNLMMSPEKSVLKKILGINQVDDELVEKIRKVGEFRREQKNQQALDLILSLPDKIKNSEVMLGVSLGLAAQTNSEKYHQLLNDFVEKSGIENVANLVVVDYFFFKQEYE